MLITGLAATGAPAQAAFAGDLGGQVQSSHQVPSPGNGKLCACRTVRDEPQARTDGLPVCKRACTIIIYLPTVQLKADRALE